MYIIYIYIIYIYIPLYSHDIPIFRGKSMKYPSCIPIESQKNPHQITIKSPWKIRKIHLFPTIFHLPFDKTPALFMPGRRGPAARTHLLRPLGRALGQLPGHAADGLGQATSEFTVGIFGGILSIKKRGFHREMMGEYWFLFTMVYGCLW